MTADHLLHVAPENGWPGLTLSCLPSGEHYCLTERVCTCECEMCDGVDPDHWGCDRQEHEHTFDGLPPCQTEFDQNRCWTQFIDAPLEECLVGEFPKDGAPWPVVVDYYGDGEVEIRYAPPSEAPASDQETQEVQLRDGAGGIVTVPADMIDAGNIHTGTVAATRLAQGSLFALTAGSERDLSDGGAP